MNTSLLHYVGMSASTLADSSVLEPSFHTSEMETGEEQLSDVQLKKEFRIVSTQIFDVLSSGVDQKILTEKDRRDYMEGITEKNLEAGGATTLKVKKQWLEENLRKYAPKFVSEARSMTSTFMDNIASAEKKGWITRTSAEKWYERLHERSMNWSYTKTFLQQFNEKYMANWEKIAGKKKDIASKMQSLKVTSKEIPELKKLEEAGFDDLHYTVKSLAVDTALAALAVYEENNKKTTQLYKQAKAMLENEVKLGVMRKDQAGEWLESLFNQKRSVKEIQGILKGTLAEYIGNWAKVRYRYDRALRRMDKDGVPPGTQRHDEKTFLNLSYPEKESYVQETEYALNLVQKGYSHKPIDKMKLEIRSLMAQKDWEEAQEVITNAYKVAEGEDIYELKSMEDTIRLYAGKGEEREETPDESARQVLDDIREALSEVPASIRGLYIKALYAGPQVFGSLSTLLYNRIWCWDNGYLDAEKEQDLQESSAEETKHIVKNGHNTKRHEHIDLDVVDNEDRKKAMRPYKNTWKSTTYSLDASNGSACSTLVDGLKGKEPVRDYWSTLVLKNISQDKQRELVRGANRRIKSGIRKLHKMGFGFSMIGSPVSLN